MPDLDEVVIIDVSHWQGRMDWEKAKTKIHAAYIKASEGTAYVDDQYSRNNAELTRLGIPWGAYHFFRPEKEPRAQAKHFARLVGTYTPTGEYRFFSVLKPFLDIESRPIWMSKQAMLDAIGQFVREFQATTGEAIGIYTRASFWDAFLPRTDFGEHWLWVAMYSDYAAEPIIPADWRECGKTWKMWQWSADGNQKGPEYGATGSASIDLNRYNGGLEAINRDYGLDLKPLGGENGGRKQRLISIYKTISAVNVRDNILPSAKDGPLPGKRYKKSTVWFTLPIGATIEALEEIEDGKNTWVRVGQRQVVAKRYDGVAYFS